MFTKSRKAVVSALLTAVLALAMVIPVSAGSSGQFVSEGCTGSGDAFLSGSAVHTRTVSWLTTNGNIPCNWIYVDGWFYNSNATFQLFGPGWYNLTGGSFGLDYSPPTGFSAIGVNPTNHSFCWAGGPCSGAVFGHTSYP
jgi:hypothetical protein